jgi:hypothetical protein
MLALHGFDAWGLEISKAAVATAEQYAAEQMQNPSPENFAKANPAVTVEPGTVRFVVGDFFSKDWEAELSDGHEKFDVIYDYTVGKFPRLFKSAHTDYSSSCVLYTLA